MRFSMKMLSLIFFSFLSNDIYASAIYTGNDFINNCQGKMYAQNADVCNTAIAQSFSAYMVSIELVGGVELAGCYRNYYPFLEKKTLVDGVNFLIKQYEENSRLSTQLVGFGFSVAMFTNYPVPTPCKIK